MTIAEVSKKYDITPDTLRYYERVGLLPPVKRNHSGNRDYNENDCSWIQFIKFMRSAGLPIEVLIEYVSLFQQGDKTIEQRKKLLVEQRSKIVKKIKELHTTLEYLDYKINSYENSRIRIEENLKKFDE
ncbi:MerR family transcriptional regulator [Lachnospiraceae bacterium MD1]|uniref:MerR family transcriptional regulator n=1 Tax=Variimorphobacter saccharofermentans TaxID=2755051 RepID=A0A839K0Y2_9FIRM|nr:MerR family transcriptional regulator [Variimorphobacter saccharofermentans]MBB2183384.1 MerR family transcriptional regulator [Variimorphobacter saccharofermentans]